ncbi:MAG: hypothetical protein P4L53_27885 [Candidatus Obscuribacterales bacterium]|nr:hypothetical protein [Candidatus Obscuribacterales bacterium]
MTSPQWVTLEGGRWRLKKLIEQLLFNFKIRAGRDEPQSVSFFQRLVNPEHITFILKLEALPAQFPECMIIVRIAAAMFSPVDVTSNTAEFPDNWCT